MCNAQIAEWILSLVTTPERAASTVGDLMEDGAIGGTFRLWIGVLWTALSMLWREFAASPERMVRLAGLAFLLGLGLSFICLLVITVPMNMLRGAAARTAFNSWTFTVLLTVTAEILVPFQQGRWMARRAPGRELAPCLVLAILGAALSVIAAPFGDTSVLQTALAVAFSPIPIFAGAVWVRRKRLSH